MSSGFENYAILARTNRQLAPFENICAEKNIRYKLLGKSGFWGQNEVRDALAIAGSVVMPTDSNILRALTARCALTKFLRKTDARDHKSTVTLLKEHVERTGVCASQSLMRFNDGDSSQADIIRNIGHTL